MGIQLLLVLVVLVMIVLGFIVYQRDRKLKRRERITHERAILKRYFWIPVELLGGIQIATWAACVLIWLLAHPTIGAPFDFLEPMLNSGSPFASLRAVVIQFDFLLYPKIPLPWWIGVGIGVFSLIVYMLLDRIAAGIHKQHDEHPENITRLVTTGIYSKVRHPICLGAIQFNFGMLFLLRSLWSVIPAILLSFLIYFEAVQEEKYLTEMFGKEYEDYKKRVGMFFPKI